MENKKEDTKDTRRDFVRKLAYVTPAVLTLAAAPSFARAGSDKPGDPSNPDLSGGPQSE